MATEKWWWKTGDPHALVVVRNRQACFFCSRLTLSSSLSLFFATLGVCRPGLGRGRGRGARRAAVAGTSCKRAGFKNKAEESDATLHLFLFARLSIVFEMFGYGKYEGYLCRLFSIQARTLHLAVLRGGDQERHECARSQSLRMAACADIPWLNTWFILTSFSTLPYLTPLLTPF